MTTGEIKLDEGCLRDIFSFQRNYKPGSPLVVQVTNTRPITNPQGNRLRMMISDGSYTANSILRPGCVPAPGEPGVEVRSIIKLTDYELQEMTSNKKKLIIINNFEFITSDQPRLGTLPYTSIDDYFRENPQEDKFSETNGGAAPASGSATPSYSEPKPKRQDPQHANIVAIDQLSPFQNLWTIKARVTFKSEIKTWTNQRGDGKLFNVHFMDESNEIRATAFNDMADKYYDFLKEGHVYYVSKARVQSAKKQFSTLSHNYELMLDRDTTIEECEDASDVPNLQFNFSSLDQVEKLEVNSVIDVIGVLQKVDDLFNITAKSSGRPFDRRDITIVDPSHYAVVVGLWNKTAVNFDLPVGTVIAVKGAKINDFGGRSLSLTPSATIIANPDTPEAFKLKGWYDSEGSHESFVSIKNDKAAGSTYDLDSKAAIQQRQTIEEIRNAPLTESDSWFSTKATISFVSDNVLAYPACPNEGCNKKVLEEGTQWRCEKCDMLHDQPEYRYITNVSVYDETEQIWVTMFDASARIVLDVPANDLMRMKMELGDDDPQYKQHITKALGQTFAMRIRARLENYNDVSRPRYQVSSISPLNYKNEAEALAEELSTLAV